MAEVGVVVSGQSSKDVTDDLGRLAAHHLIIVCADAEKHCPRMLPGVGERLLWPFDGPAAVEGSVDEQLAAFRRVRDEISISARLDQWLH
ncbi:MAG: hypothetical protein KF847_02805 [Pirellulales bacterium]|nr:hypothetical protein [Pirellulales bacterium]